MTVLACHQNWTIYFGAVIVQIPLALQAPVVPMLTGSILMRSKHWKLYLQYNSTQITFPKVWHSLGHLDYTCRKPEYFQPAHAPHWALCFQSLQTLLCASLSVLIFLQRLNNSSIGASHSYLFVLLYDPASQPLPVNSDTTTCVLGQISQPLCSLWDPGRYGMKT